jgi:alpha-ketoglutarate-dependent 2,4-dichlorophenoxyacetate dioxygenase
MSQEVESLHPLFGASVRGVDLREPPATELVADIRRLMDDKAVVVIREQQLDDDQHIALSRAFGPLELPPDYRTGAPRRLRAELYDASNLGVDNQVLAADSARREYNRANLIFHADSTFNDLPTAWSLLYAHILPEHGGNTEFIDTRAVYDDLSEPLRQRLVGLKGVHDLWHSHKAGQNFKVTDAMRRLMPPVVTTSSGRCRTGATRCVSARMSCRLPAGPRATAGLCSTSSTRLRRRTATSTTTGGARATS